MYKIHGLYLLVRASGLTDVGGTHQKPLLVVADMAPDRDSGAADAGRFGVGHPERG